MKQIDYISAVEQMAFKGRTDVVIMVKNVDPIDYHTLFFLEQNHQVMFFLPDDPEEDKHSEEPGGEYHPPKPPAAKRRQVDGGKIKALHEAGWPVAKIADEMRVSQNTVRNYIRKMEEKERVNENKQAGN